MVDLDVTENVSHVNQWIHNNQELLIQYAVNIFAALVILLVGSLLARLIAKTAYRLMSIKGIDDTISHFMAALLRYTILIFAFVAALGCLGVQTTSVIAVLGAASLAVALALQGSLSNFAAGVLIVVFRPFRVGEFVQLGSLSGTVDSVHVFSTTLRTGDNKTVIVPNGKIVAAEIINFSRQPHRRIDLVIGVGYDSDIDQVKQVLQQVVNEDPRVLPELGMTIRLSELAASSMNFIVRVWAPTSDYWAVYYDLLENSKKALDAHAIAIPFPQLDITMRSPAP